MTGLYRITRLLPANIASIIHVNTNPPLFCGIITPQGQLCSPCPHHLTSLLLGMTGPLIPERLVQVKGIIRECLLKFFFCTLFLPVKKFSPELLGFVLLVRQVLFTHIHQTFQAALENAKYIVQLGPVQAQVAYKTFWCCFQNCVRSQAVSFSRRATEKKNQ